MFNGIFLRIILKIILFSGSLRALFYFLSGYFFCLDFRFYFGILFFILMLPFYFFK